MDIVQLKYFIKVAQLEHMSKAADELNISQPALSSNIKKLENELNIELFDRKGKHLELNDYGRFLLESLEPLMAQFDNIFIELKNMELTTMSEVIMDAEPLFTFDGLFDKLYSLDFPKITLKNVHYPVSEIPDRILSGDVNFAAIGMNIDNARLEKQLLSQDELVMLVHKSHPLADKNFSDLYLFKNDLFVSKEKAGVPASYEQASEKACRDAGFVPRIVLKSSSRKELIDTVRSMHYVMLAPINTLENYNLDDLRIIHISPQKVFAPLYLYWKKGASERSQVKFVRKLIIDYFNEK